MYLNGQPLLSFSSPTAKASVDGASARSDMMGDSISTRREGTAWTCEVYGNDTQKLPQPPIPSSPKDTENCLSHQEDYLLDCVGRTTTSTNRSPATERLVARDKDSSTAVRDPAASTTGGCPATPRRYRTDTPIQHEPTHFRDIHRHPAGEVVSTSIREFLTWPPGGVLSVEFAILAASVLEGKEAGACHRSWSYSAEEADPAASVGSFSCAQGFLELHKL